ncbi:1494_t:CDS:2 [Gigaspora margarita]|uniref:1494_t:CDS:1 n=1 Tax=Gigaspora margarita TaxID=4874 RepID=A0ABN7VVZ5_GIGMA|nr:1494_t:CDS:2 [Gigaspora margarita]
MYKEGDTIQLFKDIILPFQDINALFRFIYPNLSANSDPQYLVERAILAPKNEHVNAINAAIMAQLAGKAVEYLSADTVESPMDSEHHLPFTFKRRQFPVQPAFAMTINKSQEQTLNWVGLYLPTPVFSHRQLYIACSRVISKKNLKVLISKRQGENDASCIDYTRNIVYPEVFQ